MINRHEEKIPYFKKIPISPKFLILKIVPSRMRNKKKGGKKKIFHSPSCCVQFLFTFVYLRILIPLHRYNK